MLVFGVLSVVFRFFPQHDQGGIAVAGALVFGAGLIAREIHDSKK